jgi:hypothetical protein
MASISSTLILTVTTAGSHTAPPQAAAVGFTYEAFSDGPWSLSTIDINNTGVPGKKWYVNMNWPRAADLAWQSFGITPPEDLSISGDNLVFAPKGQTIKPGHSGNIFTIGPIDTPPYYQGTTFVGGYYIEIQATWPHDELSNFGEGSWPDAWMWATSFLTSTANASFEWTEVDIFEAPSTSRIVHLWTHVAGQTTSTDSYVGYEVPAISGTKYGVLLVPSQGGNPPRLDWYANDVLQATSRPTPGKTQAIFDFMANDRQCLILGASQANPMTIISVRVWQTPPS